MLSRFVKPRTVGSALVAILTLAITLTSPAHARKPYATETYSTAQLQGGESACLDLLPQRKTPSLPNAASLQVRGLCSDSFFVAHSGVTKTPLLVVEKLTREQMQDAAGEERSDAFFPDPRLKAAERASLDDYRGSGFDRGHLSPAANQPDARAMQQSFALSNMVPQDPTHNRKVWNKLEQDVRKYAKRADGAVYVYSGPLFSGEVKKIGRNQVWVPTHLFKLVYDARQQRAWAHVLPNTADAKLGKPLAYAQFKRMTGMDLLAGLPLSASAH